MRQTLPWQSLETFHIDCQQREAQIRWLQSMRQRPDDQLIAYLDNITQPWQRFTDPTAARARDHIAAGRTNWLINQHLMTLRNNC